MPIEWSPGREVLFAQRARTFALAARFLLPERRAAVTTVYAFCRLADDWVDEAAPEEGVEAVRERLTSWRIWFQQGMSPSLLPEPAGLARALQAVIQANVLPVRPFIHLCDGLLSDLAPLRIPDAVALWNYCYAVAGTVGTIISSLLGGREAAALAAAVDLGVAMQLTNIVRDLGEDLGRGRCYLPESELRAVGYTPAELAAQAAAGVADDRLRRLVRLQIHRARAGYARGLAGVWLLPPENRAAILLAGRLYRAILDVIEGEGCNPLRRRAVVPTWRKLSETALALAATRLRPAFLRPPVSPASLDDTLAELWR
jgi:phytoene synthase